MTTETSDIALDRKLEDDSPRLGWLDIVVIVIYFLVVFGVGLWSSYRSSKNVQGYFLASRNMNWILVGASLFASNIGSGHFIGLAGSAAATGIAVAGYEQYAIFIILLLGWVYVPVYMSAGVYTMPEYLRERFGGQRIRIYITVLFLFLYICTRISADLYAGALFIQMSFNKVNTEWLYISVLILLAMAAVFTIAGGLSAVMWTDFVQTVLMVAGSIFLTVKAFIAVGGYNELVRRFPTATAAITAYDENNRPCAEPPDYYMNAFRSPVPGKSDLPWTGMTFGFTANALWYWCGDQVLVQRALAAKNLSHAKAGTVLTSYLKFLPLWIIIFPGMASRVLFPDRVGCADPDECERICGSRGGCTNIAFTELVFNLLPSGFSGLMLAVMMAALMSSLTSIFNSASTIFTIDVWTRFRKNPTERELIFVGRCFVVVLVVCSVLWIPVVQNSNDSRLFVHVQTVASFLEPPISAVFLLALFWDRANEPGAFWGMMTGLIVGLIRFGLEFSFLEPACGDEPIDKPPAISLLVDNVHFLHFRIVLYVLTTVVTVLVSLVTPRIPKHCLYRLTWATRHSTFVRTSITQENGGKVCQGSEVPTENKMEQTDVEEMSKMNPLSPEDEAFQCAQSIKEDPNESGKLMVHAIICMCLASFVIGYYA